MNRFPIVVRHQDAARIVKPHTDHLILTRELKPGIYEIHDALTTRRNQRHRSQGRHDEQHDPAIATVTITDVRVTTLSGLDLRTVRAAGFPTQRDFYDDWLERRHAIDPNLTIWIYRYEPADVPRLLHRRLHRGYTSDSSEGVPGEPEALTAGQLKQLVGANRRRFERDQRERVCKQRARSIKAKLSDALRAGNSDQVLALRRELERLAEDMKAA